MSLVNVVMAPLTRPHWAYGPQRVIRGERRATLESLVAELSDERQDLVGVAVYGSMARGDDGDYSDLELLAVVDAGADHAVREFRVGATKATIHLYREPALREAAQAVGAEWSLDHGKWTQLSPRIERRPVFAALPELARGADPARFDAATRMLLFGELFAHVGKVRNLVAAARTRGMAPIAARFAEHGALLLGLLARAPFTSRSTMLEEAMALSIAPAAYGALAARVMDGELGDASHLAPAIERAWAGLASAAASFGHGRDLDCDAPAAARSR